MFTPLTFSIAVLAAIIIPRIVGGPLLRVPASIALGAAAVYSGLTPIWGGVVIALAPFIITFLTILYYYWVGKRALAGKMGEAMQWSAELSMDGDTEFKQAVQNIDQTDMKEIKIIAENKSQFRELVIERASEDAVKPVGE